MGRVVDWIDHERSRAGVPPREAKATTLIGVGGTFCASHYSPEGVLHGHSYEVKAWFAWDGPRDARCFKAALDVLLKQWDHTVLPDHLAWGEEIARAVGTLAGCVEVEVSRPLERYYARWRA